MAAPECRTMINNLDIDSLFLICQYKKTHSLRFWVKFKLSETKTYINSSKISLTIIQEKNIHNYQWRIL